MASSLLSQFLNSLPLVSLLDYLGVLEGALFSIEDCIALERLLSVADCA